MHPCKVTPAEYSRQRSSFLICRGKSSSRDGNPRNRCSLQEDVKCPRQTHREANHCRQQEENDKLKTPGRTRGRVKWAEPELNRRHMDFQSIALPTELPARGNESDCIGTKRQCKAGQSVRRADTPALLSSRAPAPLPRTRGRGWVRGRPGSAAAWCLSSRAQGKPAWLIVALKPFVVRPSRLQKQATRLHHKRLIPHGHQAGTSPRPIPSPAPPFLPLTPHLISTRCQLRRGV